MRISFSLHSWLPVLIPTLHTISLQPQSSQTAVALASGTHQPQMVLTDQRAPPTPRSWHHSKLAAPIQEGGTKPRRCHRSKMGATTPRWHHQCRGCPPPRTVLPTPKQCPGPPERAARRAGFTFQAPRRGLPGQRAFQVKLPLQHVLLAEGQPVLELAGGLQVHPPCDLSEALAFLTLADLGVHL